MSKYENVIKPIVKTLSELFNKEYNYIIPGYQRPYEWENKQIEPAFESIEEHFETDDFLVFGTIQLNKVKDNEYEIIDGQQRLTTFWLFLSVLGGAEGLSYSPKNQINEHYERDLENIKSQDSEFTNQKYKDNFILIKKLIENAYKENDENYKHIDSLKEFILGKIVFVVIETNFENNNSVEKTIQIFDSLNTTGLPLDTKDLFKIKFRDYLAKSDQEINKDELFNRLNNAYSSVTTIDKDGSPYYLSEDDLLSVFKYWIIGKSGKDENISAKKMKRSNKEFFFDLFQNGEILPEVTLETFEEIAVTMNETQRILKSIDEQSYSGNSVRMYAKELLYWSGYGRFNNLLYVFVHAQAKDRTVKKDYVEKALELTELVWKYCSLFHATVGQIINDVFWFIGNEILKRVVVTGEINIGDIKNTMKNETSNHWRLQKAKFEEVIFNDVFNNTRKDFFLALSYIDDSGEKTAFDVKSQLFYYPKWTWDVEHILSQHFEEQIGEATNQIGNLMFLEHKINRRLGQKTKRCGSIEEDVKNKLGEYEKSELNSVQKLRDNYLDGQSPVEIAEKIMEIVSTRNTRKQEMLKKHYECIYEFKD